MDLPVKVHERLMAGDRYWHAVMLTLISVVVITAAFSGLRMIQMGAWLQAHTAYVRERDARWEPFLRQIEDHLTKQDADYKSIHDHMEKHERQMDSLRTK